MEDTGAGVGIPKYKVGQIFKAFKQAREATPMCAG